MGQLVGRPTPDLHSSSQGSRVGVCWALRSQIICFSPFASVLPPTHVCAPFLKSVSLKINRCSNIDLKMKELQKEAARKPELQKSGESAQSSSTWRLEGACETAWDSGQNHTTERTGENTK